MEGHITVRERVAPTPIALRSDTPIAIVGTLIGDTTDTLVDNVPKVFSSPRMFIDAVLNRADGASPSGTMLPAVRAVQANVSDDIILVKAEDETPDKVVAAINTLRTKTDGIIADIIVAPNLTGEGTDASPVCAGMESVAEEINASFIYSPVNTGTTDEANVSNALTYVSNNAYSRGICVFGRGGAARNPGIDPSAYRAGALAAADARIHKGASPRGTVIRGLSSIVPNVEFQDANYDKLLAANIDPLINLEGIQSWGLRYSAFDRDSRNPYRFLQIRRTADQIADNIPILARPYLTGNIDPQTPINLADDIAHSLRDLQAIGQINDFNSIPDPDRNTTQTLLAGRLFMFVAFAGTVPVDGIDVVVEAGLSVDAATGQIVA